MHRLKILVTLVVLVVFGVSGGVGGVSRGEVNGGDGSYGDREEKESEERLNNVYNDLATNAKQKKCDTIIEPIQEWLGSVDGVHEKALAAFMISSFTQASDFNNQTSKRVEEDEASLDAVVMNFSSQSYDFLHRERDLIKECNQTVYRMLIFYSKSNSLIPLGQQDRLSLSQVKARLSSKQADLEIQRDGQTYKLEPHLTTLMRESRDYEELLWAWNSWHDKAGEVLKADYDELLQLLTTAAKERGNKDVAEVWQRMDFDEEMEGEMDELMEQLMPFYTQLHAYVRNKLFDLYSEKVENEELKSFFANKSNPIPAHLLGNMWAQEWNNLDEILLPYPEPTYASHNLKTQNTSASHNLKTQNTSASHKLKLRNLTVDKMFVMAQEFFVSLGLAPMTQLFWRKSIVERVENVSMDCHAAAYDLHAKDDYRIMMCAEVDLANLQIIHHEMGHVVYFMAYRHLPVIFRGGANSAFHEAIGDTIALSVSSPKHLKKIGLIGGDEGDDSDVAYKNDINNLMKAALSKVAFLPFGYVVDKWRYKLFRGEMAEEDQNAEWWKLRLKYQGVIPPSDRTHHSFDAGAKYHVPANVPYARYFFSFIAQFQFHEKLCRLASQEGLLHHCDIFQSAQAGAALKEMLEEGSRMPWRQVMYKLTGAYSFNSAPLLNYFRPLHQWLLQRNEVSGWQTS